MHVGLFSSGAASAVMADRLVEQNKKPVLLFTDTNFEDEDNYRFIDDFLTYLTATYGENSFKYIRLSNERTPLQVFNDEGVLGCDRIPVCSRILKFETSIDWIKSNLPACVYFGFTNKERHRADRVIKRYKELGVDVGFPLLDEPYITVPMHEYVKDYFNIQPPRMYQQGFKHANCGGRCVRGKVSHWRHLLRVNPDRFEEMAKFEREFKGGKYTFLREMSLDELRAKFEQQLDMFIKEDKLAPCVMCTA